jgi:hypothetical protein
VSLAKLMIAIPVHNRLAIAKLCIPTVCDGMAPNDQLTIYNDGSKDWPETISEKVLVAHRRDPIGIEAQRMDHFHSFLFEKNREFTHLYLTDADALHDPDWRRTLLELQAYANGHPVCGYNTEAHARLKGNTLQDLAMSPIIWRAVAPGISYLLTRAHVEHVVKRMPNQWNWDWTVPSLLGNRMAIARESVVDHIGWGGMHHPAAEGLEGGDRALNPTPWLVAKRLTVIHQLRRENPFPS